VICTVLNDQFIAKLCDVLVAKKLFSKRGLMQFSSQTLTLHSAEVVALGKSRQWRTQKIFMGGFHSTAYDGHLYLVCSLCDVTI